jgi:formate hydrogenlyase subunit 4
METTISILQPILAIVLAPLIPGIINRTKAFFAGRHGQPFLQSYYDLWKLLHKSAVYSSSTSWVFRAAPVICLSAVLMTTLLVPLGHSPAVISFSGDIVLFAYLLGLMRFFIVAGALDTASSFEGMGASWEVQFSALAEPALLISLAVIARQSMSLSLSDMFAAISTSMWAHNCATLLFVAATMVIVLLA